MSKYPSTFELPTTDQLTGLVTSAYFRHLLRDGLLPRTVENGDPLAVLLLDGDNFDQLNTELGHEVGDKILTALAGALRQTMPDTAIVSRYGGDEFAVALPDTRLDDAFTLA